MRVAFRISAMRLAGKMAIVTGGGSGIGRAIAVAFAREGANVVICGRDNRKLDAAASEMGPRCLAIPADISESASVEQLVNAVCGRFQRIDILVNNAGVLGPVAPATDVSLEEWNWTIRTNLTGTFVCSKLIAPVMVKAGWGRIVNISSLQGKEGTELAGAYAVSKAGQIALAKVMAKELARTGVTVNCITPTVVDIGLVDRIDETRKAELLRRIPMQRFCRPAEVAEMVAFVVSDACSYTTGATFDVSGGRATW